MPSHGPPVSLNHHKPPTCAVIVCAYTEDRWADTVTAVSSVLSQVPAPDEMVLVIDHNPELQERMSDRFPEVLVVPNHHEQGLSGARNTGVEVTTADVVVFLDDDAEARPGWLAGLSRHYANPNVLGVGGRINPRWSGARPFWWPPEFDWVVGCNYTGQRTGIVRNLIGASSSFRRDLFADGGFTSGIGRSAGRRRPVGGEETEFCIRSSQAHPGGVFVYEDSAAVTHSVPKDRQTFAYFRLRCFSEGLSKAQVTESVGVADGLSSEWSYTRETLPQGFLRGLFRPLFGDLTGPVKSAVIVIGLAYTTLGYALGSLNKQVPSFVRSGHVR